MSVSLKSVGTIGGGNMAEAILKGLLRAGMQPDQLCASDPEPSRREHLAGVLGIRTTRDNAEVVRRSELVVLAVKPQQLGAATAELPRDAGPLYLSIVAGATLASLRRLLGAETRLVRCMPNTPALVSAGIAALAGAVVSDSRSSTAIDDLATMGEMVLLKR